MDKSNRQAAQRFAAEVLPFLPDRWISILVRLQPKYNTPYHKERFKNIRKGRVFAEPQEILDITVVFHHIIHPATMQSVDPQTDFIHELLRISKGDTALYHRLLSLSRASHEDYATQNVGDVIERHGRQLVELSCQISLPVAYPTHEAPLPACSEGDVPFPQFSEGAEKSLRMSH